MVLSVGVLMSGGAAAALAASDTANADTTASICTSTKNPALAKRLSADIPAALKGRQGTHAVSVYDRGTGTTCEFNAGTRFQSASVIKVTILSALLRKAEETHRGLTEHEKNLATAMITRSDNDAATALWNEVGQASIKHFLSLAGMGSTTIDASGYWGKTHITSGDQLALLKLLTANNSVLSPSSRSYALGLMSRVVAGQRWGTPAGAPPGTNVHVKNGWVNRDDGAGWRVNSLGTFDGKGHDYQMVVLTQGSSTEVYGHGTIEAVAKVIHRDVNS
jgi:beta-lactamase class A